LLLIVNEHKLKKILNMLASDFIILLILTGAIFYWLDSIRAKEIATEHGAAECKKVLLEFLDETVVIKKVRLRRGTRGQLAIYREYQFEFSSTGEYRYKGVVRLLGKYLIDIEMEPYQLQDINE
jgi:hypothetical protein